MATFVGNKSDYIQIQIERLKVLRKSDAVNAVEYKRQMEELQRSQRQPKTKQEVLDIIKDNPDEIDKMHLQSLDNLNEDLKDQLKEEGKQLREIDQEKIGDILENHSKADIFDFASNLGVFTDKELVENFKTKPKSIEFLKENITIDTLINYGWTSN